jgi:hypothetical protein
MRLLATATIAVLLSSAPALAEDVTGTASGIFVNPLPTVGSITTGTGTSNFTFGDPAGTPANHLIFTGSSFASTLETPFKVGSLSYYNGSTYNNPTSVDFALSLNFTAPALPVTSSTFTFNLVSTPNTGTADEQADFLYFPSSFSSTSFVIGGTTYSVKLVGFGNVVGDGFLASSSTELHVRENATASADLFAEVSAQSAVPEPASWAMMLAGFGLAGVFLRARRRMPLRLA